MESYVAFFPFSKIADPSFFDPTNVKPIIAIMNSMRVPRTRVPEKINRKYDLTS